MTQPAVSAPTVAPLGRTRSLAPIRAAILPYVVAVLGVGVALPVRLALNAVLGDRLPYIAFFPVVLVAALYGGTGPGLLAILLSVLAAICFVFAPMFAFQVPTPQDGAGVVGFCLVSGMMVVVADSQRRARARAEASAEEARQASEALAGAQREQRRFLREMLYALTESRLRLCDTADDLPSLLPEEVGPATPVSRTTLKAFRRAVNAASEAAGFPEDRRQELETGAGEAAMNAAVHAGGGTGRVLVDRSAGVVQVWVTDHGRGIADAALHRATLERGFSTGGTLGHGFWLMLRSCDRVFLLTGPEGTTVAIEQDRTLQPPPWARF